MNGAPGRPHLQTLGERLSNLCPGDACPWCGARLETGPDEAARRAAVMTGPSSTVPCSDSTQADVGRTPAQGLVCPDCGSEIDDMDPSEASTLANIALRAFCRAA